MNSYTYRKGHSHNDYFQIRDANEDFAGRDTDKRSCWKGKVFLHLFNATKHMLKYSYSEPYKQGGYPD